MRKIIWLAYFLVTWTQATAHENDMGYPGDAVIHYAGCHLEDATASQQFDTEEEAKKFISENENEDHHKWDYKLFEVKEKKG